MEQLPAQTTIWRYMDFLSFYSFLLTNSLFFRRLDKYTDAFEGVLPEQTQLDLLAYRKSIPHTSGTEAKNWLANNLAKIAEFKSYTLSNSWTIGEDENYALWKIYLGGHSDGVAIKTTAGSLRNCFMKDGSGYEISCGVVKYESLAHNQINIYSVATNKRPPYAYEKEYRALIINQRNNHWDPDTNSTIAIPRFEVGENVSVDPEGLIDNLYISSFSCGWFKSLLQTTLNNLLPGFDHDKIIHSMIQDK